jgi:hypothetical protein
MGSIYFWSLFQLIHLHTLFLKKTKTTFMQTGLVHLHNLLRWIILILLFVSIYKSYVGWTSKKQFAAADKKIWLFTMIASHITLLLGLYQWTFGSLGLFTGPNRSFGEVMKDPTTRFFQVEHPVSMIIAIVLITFAHGMAKKSFDDTTKYRKAFLFFLIALVLVLGAVPWPFREIGRPWFPGM